jgi:hypothetical protein
VSHDVGIVIDVAVIVVVGRLVVGGTVRVKVAVFREVGRWQNWPNLSER